MTPLAFTGHFSGPFGSGVRNAPIPDGLVRKFAGEEFTKFEIRQSIAVIDDLLDASRSASEGTVQIPGAQNLIVLLRGKIYPQYECNSVEARAPISAFAEIRAMVRSRLLNLTFELESRTSAGEITVDASPRPEQPPGQPMVVNHITKQIIHGDSVTSAAAASDSARMEVNINTKDPTSLLAGLRRLGLDGQPAEQLADAIASDEVTEAEPVGSRTRKWLEANAPGVAGKMIVNLLIPLILQFHGLAT